MAIAPRSSSYKIRKLKSHEIVPGLCRSRGRGLDSLNEF